MKQLLNKRNGVNEIQMEEKYLIFSMKNNCFQLFLKMWNKIKKQSNFKHIINQIRAFLQKQFIFIF